MRFLGGKKRESRQLEQGRHRRTTLNRQAPSAFSYHAQRSERPEGGGRQQASLAQQRNRMLSLQFWVRRSGLLIALVAVVVCVISILSLSNNPRIILLDNDGTQSAFHDTGAYQASAKKHLSSSIWNRNKITVNTGALSSQLRKQYPELASVNVTLPLIGHRPIVYLRANPPAFVLQAVNGTYVLDSSGTALITKDAAPDGVVATLPVISDQTGIRAQLGKQIISSSEAAFIQTVVASLTAKDVAIESLVLPAGAVQQLDVRVTGKPYVVKFNMHDVTTARQQAGTYLATASNLAAQNITPAQYVDVRVLGRAYYQ